MSTANARRSHPVALAIGQWRAGDGWPHRSFRLAPDGPIKGQLLFLGGRGDFFEKYLEAFGHWAGRGWEISGFDWRGQGGSGRTHAHGYCHIADFGLLVNDLAEFAQGWGREGSVPHIAIGHSMGGHLLLRALAERRVRFAAAVLLAPMLGIRAGSLPSAAVNRIGALGALPVLAQRPLWKGRPRSNPGHLTSCPLRHADKQWWKDRHPDIGRGGPTWQWLAAATHSMARLERALRRDPPPIDALVLTGSRDTVVDNRAIARIAGRLPSCHMQEIGRGGHELLRESDGPRLAALAAIDRFIDSAAS